MAQTNKPTTPVDSLDTNHTVLGTDGNDTINTGDSHSLVYGVDGNDTIQTGSAVDIIFGGAGNDVIKGGGGHDVIFGGDGNDTLWGNDGHDVIFGGAGNDTIMAGDGHDVIDGGDGRDCAAYMDSDAAVFINFRTHEAHGGYAEGDTYIHIEQVRGSEYNDVLVGNDSGMDLKGGAGQDTIIGGAGNDELRGDGGKDLLTGGAGSDQILFDPTKGWDGAVDTMTDFQAGKGGDWINFSMIQKGFVHADATHAESDITAYVSLQVVDGDTHVYFDRDGAGSQYQAQEVLVLQHVTGLDVRQLYADHNIVI
jgi:Ca2+-binding RTX toxin-like protein